MKTLLNSPDIADMTKQGFNLVDFADNYEDIPAIENSQPPWDSWFFCPTSSGNVTFIECWHKAN